MEDLTTMRDLAKLPKEAKQAILKNLIRDDDAIEVLGMLHREIAAGEWARMVVSFESNDEYDPEDEDDPDNPEEWNTLECGACGKTLWSEEDRWGFAFEAVQATWGSESIDEVEFGGSDLTVYSSDQNDLETLAFQCAGCERLIRLPDGWTAS